MERYRLAVVELIVPPLRDHRDDIPSLAIEFARRYGEKFGLGPLAVEPALIDVLVAAPWPGNVRQLENTIARLAALSTGGLISVADYEAATGGRGGEAASGLPPSVSHDAMPSADDVPRVVPGSAKIPSKVCVRSSSNL